MLGETPGDLGPDGIDVCVVAIGDFIDVVVLLVDEIAVNLGVLAVATAVAFVAVIWFLRRERQ